ncbi:MAG: ABC transporter permease [Ruminococcaceae bacterium]|nr:ABC transporter permease [Oscillospiraceae bacterium]
MHNFLHEIVKSSDQIITALGQHITISVTALILGIIVAVPAGILLSVKRKAAAVALGVFGVINTIPSIVLLGVAMIFLGLGFTPAVAVLFLYSILPIMRATYTGISEVNPKYIKAAKGMGMSRLQILRMVQFPLALPAIITGIRLSAIYIISWATLSAFIGGGGLGDLIWMGLQSYNFNLVLCGAVPATLLSLLVSALLNRVIKLASRHKSEEVGA